VSREQVVDSDKLVEFGELVGYPLTGKNRMDEGERTLGDDLMEFITLVGALRSEPLEVWERTHPDLDPDVCVMFGDAYTQWKNTFGYMDFNDMLRVVAEMPGAVDIGVDHLFVDEGQDLSPLQWAVVDKLAGAVKFLTVVGDDDQAIYAWAGADPHRMAALGGRSQVLSLSHRVPREAHRLAQGIISRVEQRVAKEYAPRGAEGKYTLETSLMYLDPPGPDTLVLYRNHSTRPEVEEWLIENRVRYTVIGSSMRSAFEDRYANSVRAFLTLRAGKEISTAQLGLLQKTCRTEWKQDLMEKNFKDFLRADWWDCLEIPNRRVGYLSEVDLFEKPTTRISTIHSSKGMEARHVILMNEMGLRTSEAMGDDEHRVWYVAVTRTKDILTTVEGSNPYNIPES
jgi:DNA helicase-2/ATP-dependent DNA helicase PcrA